MEVSGEVAVKVGNPAAYLFEQRSRCSLIEAIAQHDVGVVMSFDVTEGRKQIDALRLGVVRRKFRLSSQQGAAEISPESKFAGPRAGQKMGSLEWPVSASRVSGEGNTHEFLGGDDVENARDHSFIVRRPM